MEQRIQISIDDGVADVRLNRPDKMNALDPAMFSAHAGLAAETAEQGALLGRPNYVEAVMANLEKRAPNWSTA